MASNADLTKNILALDPDAVTEGLNNAKLTALLKSLKLKATATPPPAAPAVVDIEPGDLLIRQGAIVGKPHGELAPEIGCTVAKGKSITTKRGMLSEGEEIKAEYLGGGAEALAALIASKHVVE